MYCLLTRWLFLLKIKFQRLIAQRGFVGLRFNSDVGTTETSTQTLYNSYTRELVGWMNWFNAELSLKRYWRGPMSQEVGETIPRGRQYLEGDCTYRETT